MMITTIFEDRATPERMLSFLDRTFFRLGILALVIGAFAFTAHGQDTDQTRSQSDGFPLSREADLGEVFDLGSDVLTAH